MSKAVADTMGVRFTKDDRKIIAALRAKLGVTSISEVLRMALRALATKEGVTV